MSDAATIQSSGTVKPGPYDSLREFVAAAEARGRVVRISEIDQDAYEFTGLMYRLIDRLGLEKAPVVIVDRVKIDGQWRDGPIVVNQYGRWEDEALVFGVEQVTSDQQAMFRATQEKLLTHLDSAGNWNTIPPVEWSGSGPAPCKEVILTGADIDITQFPWLKNNPADVGRYINMGAVFIEDPEAGANVGTYRCQVKGPARIGVNPSPGQHGWLILNAMRRRGDRTAPCSIALGVDPITFSTSATKMADFGEHELDLAGGLRGRPVEVVKSETSDIMVPAHAEMIVEGEIPLTEFEEEGPYAEMYGFLGAGEPQAFFMTIKAVTHRSQPWFQNSFTGLTLDMPKSPQLAGEFARYSRLIPNLRSIVTPKGANGITFVQIQKRFPGEGMAAGQAVASNPGLNKIVIVVDDDVDVLNPVAVLHAMGARWQPGAATAIIPRTQMMMPDPSRRELFLSSKIIIDATRQLPAEGGPEEWAPVSRQLIREALPELFRETDEKWRELFARLGA